MFAQQPLRPSAPWKPGHEGKVQVQVSLWPQAQVQVSVEERGPAPEVSQPPVGPAPGQAAEVQGAQEPVSLALQEAAQEPPQVPLASSLRQVEGCCVRWGSSRSQLPRCHF